MAMTQAKAILFLWFAPLVAMLPSIGAAAAQGQVGPAPCPCPPPIIPAYPPMTWSGANGGGCNVDQLGLERISFPAHRFLLTIPTGHSHGGFSGSLWEVRMQTVYLASGCAPSPFGGRLTETLTAGASYFSATYNHNGTNGVGFPFNTPLALRGLPFAAQATVMGGGFVDHSSALLGTL